MCIDWHVKDIRLFALDSPKGKKQNKTKLTFNFVRNFALIVVVVVVLMGGNEKEKGKLR